MGDEEPKKTEEQVSQKDIHVDDTIYDSKERTEEGENAEITPAEEGFMKGYEEGKDEHEKMSEDLAEIKEDVEEEAEKEQTMQSVPEEKETAEEKEEAGDVEEEIKKEKKSFLAGLKEKRAAKKEKKKEEKEKKQIEKEVKHEEKKEEHKAKEESHEHKERKGFIEGLKDSYWTNYKKLLILPLALLVLSLIIIGVQIAMTGDFVQKDVSLKGGITITIPTEQEIDIDELEDYLNSNIAGADLNVRSLRRAGNPVGVIIDGSEVEADDVISLLESQLGELKPGDYSVEFMGSGLGDSFFKETLKAIYISFLFMGIVIFLYFGTNTKIKILSTILTLIAAILIFGGTSSIIKDIISYLIGIGLLYLFIKYSPASFIVILNVFADVVITLAIINLFGFKLSTAGIAAFLMVIGYSVDTNILLSTKMLKKKEGSLKERVFGAMNTGFMMTATTIGAITVALLFSQSDVIRQIMIILLIGLLVDAVNTWIQNVGLLRIFLERKHGQN